MYEVVGFIGFLLDLELVGQGKHRQSPKGLAVGY